MPLEPGTRIGPYDIGAKIGEGGMGTNAVLFVTSGGGGAPLVGGQLAVLDRKSGRIVRLKLAGVHPRYVASGHIVYATRDGSLTAVPFDAARLAITGNPVPIVQDVYVKSSGAANFDVAADGRLVYASGGDLNADRTITWVDRAGKETPTGSPKRTYYYARIAPDGRRLSLDIRDQEQDVWIWDARGTLTRLTSSEGSDQYGLWTPDGQRVILYSAASGTQKTGLYAVQADGTGRTELLYEPPAGAGNPFPNAISPDSKVVIFRAATAGKNDLFTLQLGGDRAVKPLLATEHDELNAAFSPDGHWIAYQSDLSGRCPGAAVRHVRLLPGRRRAELRRGAAGRQAVRHGQGGRHRRGREVDHRRPQLGGGRAQAGAGEVARAGGDGRGGA